MPLTMRPTGLSSAVDTIYSGDWAIDRIYEQRGGPDFMHWLWSLHGIFGHAHQRPRGNARRGQSAARIDMAAMAGVGEAA